MLGTHRHTTLAWLVYHLVAAGLCLAIPQSVAAQENARLTADTFVYLYPDASRPPFVRIESGSLVTILRHENQWVNIRIIDVEQKERYGYVEAKYVRPWTAGDSQRQAAPATGQLESISSLRRSDKPAATGDSSIASHPAPGTRSSAAAPGLIRLSDIRRIFIEKMPDDLDQYISAEITKEFKGRVVVVLSKDTADAIMRGIGENHTGVGAAITGRYLGLHDNASGAVSLLDRDETTVLWASEAGDRSLMFSLMRRGGQRKVADRLVNNLKKALSQ